MKVEVDAADQLQRGEPASAGSGIAGQLASLEMLLYPSSAYVVEAAALSLAGTIEILPPEGPLTVLVRFPGVQLPIRVSLMWRECLGGRYDSRCGQLMARVGQTITAGWMNNAAHLPESFGAR
jgi:hypothetical protein